MLRPETPERPPGVAYPVHPLNIPYEFDRLNMTALQYLEARKVSTGLLSEYLDALRTVRVASMKLWLDTMASYAAVVNLPSMFRAHPGRVYEGIAAGRPVVTWRIPERPAANSLFDPETEVLQYSTPEELEHHLRRVLGDPDYADLLAANAREKFLRFHTMEVRMKGIFE